MTGNKEEEHGCGENVCGRQDSGLQSKFPVVKGQNWSSWQAAKAQDWPQNRVSMTEVGRRFSPVIMWWKAGCIGIVEYACISQRMTW